MGRTWIERVDKMGEPRVSVLMSVYNGERYLREAVESILDQTFAGKKHGLEDLCRKHNADYLEVNTREDYVPKLIKLFKVRKNIRKCG